MLASGMPAADRLQDVQRLRKGVLRVLCGLFLVPILLTDSYWYKHASPLYGVIETLGAVLIVACIFGRTWCSLYIGGRKKRELVMSGPYSMSRNPLYVFTLIGAFGAGAQSGSLTVATWFVGVVFLVFDSVVRQEETFLVQAFPEDFAAYAVRVPRYLPRFSAWRDVDELIVRPALIRRTFLDATLFLLAIPAADIIETLQRHGTLLVLMYLP